MSRRLKDFDLIIELRVLNNAGLCKGEKCHKRNLKKSKQRQDWKKTNKQPPPPKKKKKKNQELFNRTKQNNEQIFGIDTLVLCLFCCCCCFLNNCIVPMGFLPWEIQVAFPGESQLRQSRATQSRVHAGCYSVSIIHQTLTWTSGSLPCAQM